MPKTTTKGSLRERIEAENARKDSRNAKPKTPGATRAVIPAGVEGGVAKLTRVDFDTIENGNYAGSQRFYCHGIVVEPKEFEGTRIEGLLVQPSIITLDDVKSSYGDTSFAENVAKAENRLKLLGFPTEDFEDLESDTLEYFQEAGEMYFSFRTWNPEDSDRIIHIIQGPVRDYVPLASEEIDEEPHYSSNTVAPPKPKTTKADPLTALASKADDDDYKAQLEIASTAKDLGIDPEDPKFNDWSDVVQAIKNAKQATPSSTGDFLWEVGDVAVYNGKDVEITKLLGDTAIVTSLVDSEVYENIELSSLKEIV